MRGHSLGHPFHQGARHVRDHDLHLAWLKTVGRFCASVLVAWVMGALFLSGWHFATLGSAMMAVSVTEATLFPVIVALACLCHICARDVSFRAGLTLAIAITIVAFPAGAVLG